MTAPESADRADQSQNTPGARAGAEVPATAPQVGNPGARRRIPSARFLRDARLPHALQNPLYQRYWWSQLISLSGTWMQQVAPDDLRGRVLSIVSLAFNGVMPFATVAVSGSAELIGQPIVLGLCAVLTASGAFFLWRRFAWQAFVSASGPSGSVS